MPKPFHPQVITANDLAEGTTVYLGLIGWTGDIRAARIAETPGDAEMLETAGARAEAENLVVGAYLLDVRLEGGVPVPLSRRERIKAAGEPTIPVGPEAEAPLARDAA